MKSFRWIWSLMLLASVGLSVSLFVAGCQQGNPSKSGSQPGAKKQPDEELIKAQGICPIQNKKLGSMGKPFKVMVKGDPVFLCCESCKDEALGNPEKTLSTVKELKRKNQK